MFWCNELVSFPYPWNSNFIEELENYFRLYWVSAGVTTACKKLGVHIGMHCFVNDLLLLKYFQPIKKRKKYYAD
ncbi:hypothetical protein MCY_00935 [Bartonella rattimassiliensis 15908]|uniref:Uncharacterized protein n=1 Tax=Bartonella rattimassiliensis 15908 TaxID=1094556 RepID=J0QK35_9HYPH|nr:hypothetical protein MCY_00935 [Bartonella rattimassiliensis 15908]